MTSFLTPMTVRALFSAPLAASLSLVAVLLLLGLMILKEIVGDLEVAWALRLGKGLNVALVPLLITFVWIVIGKMAEFLQ